MVRHGSAKPLSPGSNPGDASKKKSRVSGFFFLYSSLFSFHSSLFSKSPARLFQRRDKREERKEKVAFLPLVEKQFVIKRIHDSSSPNKKWREYLFYRPFTTKNALLSTKTKVRFLNDVCLRQMMRGLATFWGKHRIITGRSGATSYLRSKCIISPQGNAPFKIHTPWLI